MSLPAVTEATETREAAGQGSAGALAALGVNANLLAFQFLNFAVAAGIIWWLILKPLVKKMNERSKLIEESLVKAKKIDDALAGLDSEAKMRLEKTQQEARQIIAQAREAARQAAEGEKEKTAEELKLMQEEAQEKITREKQEMLSKLKNEVGSLVFLASEKLLEEKTTPDTDKILVEKILKNIG